MITKWGLWIIVELGQKWQDCSPYIETVTVQIVRLITLHSDLLFEEEHSWLIYEILVGSQKWHKVSMITHNFYFLLLKHFIKNTNATIDSET